MVGSNYKVYPSNFLGKGCFARQGCVIYPISLEELTEYRDLSKFEEVNASIVFDFPIGSIEYTNSREFLSYTPATIASLDKAFAALKAEIEAEVKAKLAKVRRPYERAALIANNDLFSVNRFAFLSDTHKLRYSIGEAFKAMLPREKRYGSGFARCAINSRGERVYQTRYNWISSGFNGRVGMIYLDEMTKTGNRKMSIQTERAVKWLEQQGLDYAFVLEDIPPLKNLRMMGFPPITRASNIPQLPKKPRVYTGGGNGFARFTMEEEKIPTNALFIFKNRGAWIDEDFQPVRHSRRVEYQQIAEILDRPIVTINTRANEKLDKFKEGREFIYGMQMSEIVAGLADDQIAALVAIINNKRFQAAGASNLFNELDGAEVVHLTPYAPLSRFGDLNRKAREEHHELVSSLGTILRDANSDDNALINQIIERGRVLGLELLSPAYWKRKCRRTGDWINEHVMHDMSFMPKGMPPMFAQIINDKHWSDAEVAYLTKEVFDK